MQSCAAYSHYRYAQRTIHSISLLLSLPLRSTLWLIWRLVALRGHQHIPLRLPELHLFDTTTDTIACTTAEDPPTHIIYSAKNQQSEQQPMHHSRPDIKICHPLLIYLADHVVLSVLGIQKMETPVKLQSSFSHADIRMCVMNASISSRNALFAEVISKILYQTRIVRSSWPRVVKQCRNWWRFDIAWQKQRTPGSCPRWLGWREIIVWPNLQSLRWSGLRQLLVGPILCIQRPMQPSTLMRMH